jgi:1-acyl-sn-glycerol-3-phosphate acyltransferase
VMNAREVARAARRSIDVAHERLFKGDALLVFVEGTRSRTRGMQQTLTAVTRYFDFPDVWVLPAGITGTEEMFPIGEDGLHQVTAVATVGPPIEARDLHERARGDRRLMMDAVGSKIAALLPPEYRGAYS